MSKGPDINDRKRKGLKVVPDFPSGANDYDDEGPPAPAGKTQADKIVQMCVDLELRVVRSLNGDAFAVVSPPAAVPVRSRHFKTWLTGMFNKTKNQVPSTGSIDAAINTLEGRALGEEQVPIFVRMGEAEGCRYVDLGEATAGKAGGVVRITADGWEIDPNPPVLFFRPPAFLSLPTPVSGGRIDELRRFIRVEDEDWALVLMWLVAATSPMKSGAFPILSIHGNAGTAKTGAAVAIRQLIDPSSSPVRKLAKDSGSLPAVANNTWVLNFDNVGSITPEWSDDLCTLVSAGGFDGRALYTNYDISVIKVKRPVILNGITDFATRTDLLSRTLRIRLQPLADSDRKTEADIDAGFAEAHARMLGALLDGAVASMAVGRSGPLSRRRLADAERLATACEGVFGLEPGATKVALDMLDNDRVNIALEAWPVFPYLKDMLTNEHGKWVGTASDLLKKLNQLAPAMGNKAGWPQGPNALSGRLSLHHEDLIARGIIIARPQRSADAKKIDLSMPTAQAPDEPDPPFA